MNGTYHLCSKNGLKCTNNSPISGKEIHEIASTWQVSASDTIFEQPMQITQEEQEYHQLKFSKKDVERAKIACQNVCFNMYQHELVFLFLWLNFSASTLHV